MNTIEIRKMSKAEKLQAMETLWDALSHDQSGIESPDWHEEVLADRKSKMEAGTAIFRPIEALRK